jgi:glycosyltransferase involved in cell wall biosynthesis
MPNTDKPRKKLNILIGGDDFSRRTGMPMYLLNLSMGLIRRGHKITIVAPQIGLDKSGEIRQVFWKDIDQLLGEQFDVLVLNEPLSKILIEKFPKVPAYNIIHSARPEDDPIMGYPQVRKYIPSKKTDLEYIRAKGVPENKIEYIPIPIDFGKFKPREDAIEWDIVAPCTFDFLRQPMLKDLIDQAKKGKKVLIIGENCGCLGHLGQYASIKTLKIIPEAVENIEDYMAKAEAVAGILLGTVTIEAWAMGRKTIVYDLAGRWEEYPKPSDYQKHDLGQVAVRFEKMFTRIWADVIVPHYNRKDLLVQCLESVPKLNYNVIVADFREFFARNCNLGAKKAKNDTLFFVNDDTILNPKALWQMLDDQNDIVGCPQLYQNGELFCFGIGLRRNPVANRIEYFMSHSAQTTLFPSGAVFKIPRKLFWKLGGFNENFHNGGEDQDLFLSAYERGATFGMVRCPIVHYLSQSARRFDEVDENEALLRKLWLDNISRMKKVFNL